MAEKTFRLVVCIDVPADTLQEAYQKMRGYLVGMPMNIGWETSDEWFEHGTEGAGDPDVLQTAIVAVLDEEPET